MRILLFGASGMVGQGVLRECLQAKDVESVTCVVRAQLPQANRKLDQAIRADVTDLSGLDLGRFDACFWTLGVSSNGLTEDAYRKVTVGVTAAAADQLRQANPQCTFVFVSGAGSDATGTSRTMWRRVKGEAENAILARFPNGYVFRPGFIRPLDGIRSRTALYNRIYSVLRPVAALYARVAPASTLTTRSLGQAMLSVARHGFHERVLEAPAINEAARAA